MTNISASDVGKLRRQTGSGMMDCKNALVESNGDFDLAADEFLDSNWASQTPARANEITQMIRSGDY